MTRTAATESVQNEPPVETATPQTAPEQHRSAQPRIWRQVTGFGLAFFVVTAVWAWWLGGSGSGWRTLAWPLLPTVVATLTYWSRQRWRSRSKMQQEQYRAWREALETVCYEAINAANAIRANVIALKLANPDLRAPEHLGVLDESLARIAKVVQKAQDPVEWWREKQQRRKSSKSSLQDAGEEARSRIAL